MYDVRLLNRSPPLLYSADVNGQIDTFGSDEPQLHLARWDYSEMLPCELDKRVQCVVLEALKPFAWQEWKPCPRKVLGFRFDQPGADAPNLAIFEELCGCFKSSQATSGIRSRYKSDCPVFVKVGQDGLWACKKRDTLRDVFEWRQQQRRCEQRDRYEAKVAETVGLVRERHLPTETTLRQNLALLKIRRLCEGRRCLQKRA